MATAKMDELERAAATYTEQAMDLGTESLRSILKRLVRDAEQALKDLDAMPDCRLSPTRFSSDVDNYQVALAQRDELLFKAAGVRGAIGLLQRT
jgi:hypothetical protein